MKSLVILLLLVSTAHAGRYRELFRQDRQALEKPVTSAVAVQKQTLTIYGTPNCRRCVTAYRELAADPFVRSHYHLLKKNSPWGLTQNPRFLVKGGDSEFVGYPNKAAVLRWLKTQKGTKQ